jgi:hypothetical protein
MYRNSKNIEKYEALRQRKDEEGGCDDKEGKRG